MLNKVVPSESGLDGRVPRTHSADGDRDVEDSFAEPDGLLGHVPYDEMLSKSKHVT